MQQVSVFWSRLVTLVALMGLVPFIAGLIATVFPHTLPIEQVIFERALIGYGALILAFLGGVRWGIRLQGGAGSDLTFVMGILGSGLGLFTLLMPYTFGLIALTFGFGAQGAWDVRSGMSGGVPPAYARLRNMMTWLVCALLLAILIGRTIVPQG